MRPIDADELTKKLKNHHDFYVEAYGGFSNLPIKEKARVDEITGCIASVRNAPTLTLDDLRPHGRWEKKVVRGVEVPCCSVCGRGTGTTYEYDYCPNCGVKMQNDASE